ncbi:MAG: hypothetical protein NTW66_02935 [Candidatus Magasanikbacteria bacterium]|nr:hypothetical protein [Candidatus Magasanikbacteria bacterium]
MENKGDKKIVGHKCGMNCSCAWTKLSWGHLLLKIFLALVMIALALAISMAVFYKLGHGGKSESKRLGVMRGQVSTQACFGEEKGGGVIMMGGGNMAFKAGKEVPAMPERTYGNITKIEANQITVKNNAAQDQIILSLADTVIVSSTVEVGLASLQVGQNIIVYGSPDKDKKLEAKLIQIQ